MPDVFQPFLDLLTNPPGNLIYHLVVAFSLVAALPVSLYLGKSDQPVLSRRLLIGFLPLVVIRLALFVVGGLAWQGLIAEQALLPALERSAGLVSLIILLWLWGFPQPQRRADFAALLFSFFGLFFGMFLCLWWLNQPGTASFNGSLIDQTATITAVVVALLAISVLILKRPDGWSAGLLFFLVIASGYLLHWLFPSPEQDASGVIRLAEIIAGVVLAGEISLASAISSSDWVSSHERYGRNR